MECFGIYILINSQHWLPIRALIWLSGEDSAGGRSPPAAGSSACAATRLEQLVLAVNDLMESRALGKHRAKHHRYQAVVG